MLLEQNLFLRAFLEYFISEGVKKCTRLIVKFQNMFVFAFFLENMKQEMHWYFCSHLLYSTTKQELSNPGLHFPLGLDNKNYCTMKNQLDY